MIAPLTWWVARMHRDGWRTRGWGLPYWGWAGAGLLVASWATAWGLLPVATVVREHSFTALWLGYIVVIQGLTWHRAGRCLLTQQPWRLLALFPASAAFWWLFEYLNQFAGNWRYGGGGLSGWEYFLVSTLPFATVIPAVVSTRDLLATTRLRRAFQPCPRIGSATSLHAATAALIGGIAALMALPLAPSVLFPVVWLAPTAILVAIQRFGGERRMLEGLARGDWRELELAALAGLVCGVFWELWNTASLARWTYEIPYVGALHVFEMPLLGYAGYLPFGVCAIATATLILDRPGVIDLDQSAFPTIR